jgi:hypothetical protein
VWNAHAFVGDSYDVLLAGAINTGRDRTAMEHGAPGVVENVEENL